MNDDHDQELRALFSAQREIERESAPLWNARRLDAPRAHRAPVLRWVFALALVLCAAAWLLRSPAPSNSLVSEFSTLIDSPPGELFASLASPPTTDFLLPTHLTIRIP